MEEKRYDTNTTDALSEKSSFVMVGMLPIVVKPLTVLQVQRIGEIAEAMGEYEETDDDLLTRYAFRNNREAGLLADAVVVSLFRSRINRFLFGGYVKRHLDSKTLRKCVTIMRDNFDFRFFFQGTVFLRGMRRKRTEKETEGQATARGGSWVES